MLTQIKVCTRGWRRGRRYFSGNLTGAAAVGGWLGGVIIPWWVGGVLLLWWVGGVLLAWWMGGWMGGAATVMVGV